MTTPFKTIESSTLTTINGGVDWIAIGEAGFQGMHRGAVTGLVTGGLTGAAIGSAAAGVGAVPGAVIGAGMGAATGMFVGMDTAMAGEYLRQRTEARRAPGR